MEEYLEILKSIELFKGITESELQLLLSCFSANLLHFNKNQIVFMSGQNINHFGVVLSGKAQIYQEDIYGNKSILSNIGVGDLFGESFAYSETKIFPVSMMTTTESDLLFIDSNKLASPCTNACSFHSKLIQNMLRIIATKNISLTQKIEFTSKRTTREKLMAYLSSESQKSRSRSFSISFNRQQLADYLFVDRSAMSAELSKLRDDGILKFNKSQFELL